MPKETNLRDKKRQDELSEAFSDKLFTLMVVFAEIQQFKTSEGPTLNPHVYHIVASLAIKELLSDDKFLEVLDTATRLALIKLMLTRETIDA